MTSPPKAAAAPAYQGIPQTMRTGRTLVTELGEIQKYPSMQPAVVQDCRPYAQDGVVLQPSRVVVKQAGGDGSSPSNILSRRPVRLDGEPMEKARQVTSAAGGNSPHSWAGVVSLAPKPSVSTPKKKASMDMDCSDGQCRLLSVKSSPDDEKAGNDRQCRTDSLKSSPPEEKPASRQGSKESRQGSKESQGGDLRPSARPKVASPKPAVGGAAALNGQPYIDFEFEELDGGAKHKVSDFACRGKPVVLEFYTFW